MDEDRVADLCRRCLGPDPDPADVRLLGTIVAVFDAFPGVPIRDGVDLVLSKMRGRREGGPNEPTNQDEERTRP